MGEIEVSGEYKKRQGGNTMKLLNIALCLSLLTGSAPWLSEEESPVYEPPVFENAEGATSFNDVINHDYSSLIIDEADPEMIEFAHLYYSPQMSDIKGVPTYTDKDFFYQYGHIEEKEWPTLYLLDTDGSLTPVDFSGAFRMSDACFIRGTYYGDGNAIVAYDQSCGPEVEIPEGTATIGREAFATANNTIGMDLPPFITMLILPEGLRIIGTCAFANQTPLSEVLYNGISHQIPPTVTWIGDNAFYGTSLGYLNYDSYKPAGCTLENECDPVVESTVTGYLRKEGTTWVYDFKDSRNSPNINMNYVGFLTGSDIAGGTYDKAKHKETWNDVPTRFSYHYGSSIGTNPSDIQKVIFETYTLTYSLRENDPGSLSFDTPIILDGVTSVGEDNVPSVKLPRSAYEVKGYFLGEESYTAEEIAEAVFTRDTHIEVRVGAIEYAISYHLNGGENNPDNPETYTIEDEITFKDPSKTGYDFAGWFTDEELTDQITGIELGSTGELDVYAKWTPSIYKVSYELAGGRNHPDNPGSYMIETPTSTLPDASRSGYIFTGWKEGNSIPLGSHGDKTFTAQYEVEVYPITYDLNGGINDSANPASYTVEDEFIFRPALKDHYVFTGWTLEGNAISGIAKGTTGPLHLVASYVPEEYAIHYELNGGTNDPNNPASYNIETGGVVLNDPAKTGYDFTGWQEGNTIPAGSTGEMTFTATWKIRMLPVTFIGANDAVVDRQAVAYNDKAVPIIAPSVFSYTFEGWYYDKTFTRKYTFNDVITAPTTVYAKYVSSVHDIDDGGPFTTDACGTVTDRWGNVIYKGNNCVLRSNYKVPNTAA